MMMLTISIPKTTDKVVAKFFIKTLTTISRELEYDFCNEIIQALYSNVATLPTNMTGVKHGHVEIIIENTLYTTLSTETPW